MQILVQISFDSDEYHWIASSKYFPLTQIENRLDKCQNKRSRSSAPDSLSLSPHISLVCSSAHVRLQCGYLAPPHTWIRRKEFVGRSNYEDRVWAAFSCGGKHVKLKVMGCSANYSFHVTSFASRVPNSISFASAAAILFKNENNGQTMRHHVPFTPPNRRPKTVPVNICSTIQKFSFQSVQVDKNVAAAPRRNSQMNH